MKCRTDDDYWFFGNHWFPNLPTPISAVNNEWELRERDGGVSGWTCIPQQLPLIP
jgi:hypothetical protein